MARHAGDALDLDYNLGVDEGLAVHPVRDRLLWPSDCTSEDGLPAQPAAGFNYGLAHAAFLGFGGHPETLSPDPTWRPSARSQVFRRPRPRSVGIRQSSASHFTS